MNNTKYPDTWVVEWEDEGVKFHRGFVRHEDAERLLWNLPTSVNPDLYMVEPEGLGVPPEVREEVWDMGDVIDDHYCDFCGNPLPEREAGRVCLSCFMNLETTRRH